MAIGRGLAAALSFILWGLGHILAGRGGHYILALLAHLLLYIYIYPLLLPPTTAGDLLLLIPFLALSAHFAYDAYGGPVGPPVGGTPPHQPPTPQPGFCHACGVRLREAARFCHNCGARVGHQAPPAP